MDFGQRTLDFEREAIIVEFKINTKKGQLLESVVSAGGVTEVDVARLVSNA